MKHTIILLLVCVSLSISLGAQTVSYLENDVKFIDQKGTVTLSHYGERKIHKRFGFTDYVFLTNGWAEFLGGPYFKPTENSFIGLYVGLETTNNLRLGGYLYCDVTSRVLLSAFYEKGLNGSSDYYDFICKIKLKETKRVDFSISGRLRQGYGYGIPLMIKFKNSFCEGFHTHLFFTAFYNTMEYSTPTCIPTASINLEF